MPDGEAAGIPVASDAAMTLSRVALGVVLTVYLSGTAVLTAYTIGRVRADRARVVDVRAREDRQRAARERAMEVERAGARRPGPGEGSMR
jgi:hypothetical protein